MMLKKILLAALIYPLSGLSLFAAEPGIIDRIVAPRVSSPASPAAAPVNIGEIQNAWQKACSKQTLRRRQFSDRRAVAGVVGWAYNPNDVLCLKTRMLMWTTLVFPAWEKIEEIILGDSSSFKYQQPPRLPNVLNIMPAGGIYGADTQLTIIGRAQPGGKRNTYSFYLRSIGVDASEISDIKVYISAGRGTSGGTAAVTSAARLGAGKTDKSGTKPGKSDYLRKIPFSVGALRFRNYKVFAADQDSASIAPVRIFDDGVFTYLDFGEGGRSDRMLRPVAFQVIDGIDSKVNTRTVGKDNNILVIEAFGRDFTLRNGKRVICIKYRPQEVKDAPGLYVTVGGPDAPRDVPGGPPAEGSPKLAPTRTVPAVGGAITVPPVKSQKLPPPQ